MGVPFRLVWFIVLIRIYVLFLSWLSGKLFLPYDLSQMLVDDDDDPESRSYSTFVLSLANWDGVHLGFVALNQGYAGVEKMHAFFPLQPALVRFMMWLLQLPDTAAAAALAGVLLANGACVWACCQLYLLCSQLQSATATNNKNRLAVAPLAACLFALSPASIFFSAAYTESLFALFSVAGARLLFMRRWVWAGLLLSMATATRSNGILSIILLLHPLLVHSSQKWRWATTTATVLLRQCLLAMGIGLPLLAMQVYGYSVYCTGTQPAGLPSFCQSLIPLHYTHIQSKYWGQGPFKFWTLSQVPNFVIAFPMISLLSFTLSQVPNFVIAFPMISLLSFTTIQTSFFSPSTAAAAAAASQSFSRLLGVQCLSMMVLILVSGHVQTVTRMVAPLPWTSIAFALAICNNNNNNIWLRRSIYAFSFLYLSAGSVLFPLFYPFV